MGETYRTTYAQDEIIDVAEGERWVLKRDLPVEREGEIVWSPETEAVLERLETPIESESEPDPGRHFARTLAEPIRIRQPADPPGTIRRCKDPECSNIVEGSRNPGVAKLFCCPQHAHRYHAREYARRRRGTVKGSRTLHLDRSGSPARFVRVKPPTARKAEELFRVHQEWHHCPLASEDTNSRCPASFHFDTYGTDKHCLIYAVLLDDWKEARAKEQWHHYIRRLTTNDGEWIPDHLMPTMEELCATP